MSPLKLLEISIASLAAHKLRTLLAMLGIVIGVGAVIVMIAIGQGAEQETASRISSLGSNLLFVRPGFSRQRFVRTAAVRTLVPEDAAAIRGLAGLVTETVPEASVTGQVKYFSKNTSTTVLGTTPNYPAVLNHKVAEGRAWNDDEGRTRQRVCVLGATVAGTLFGEGEAIGRSIKINGVTFQVLGVLQAKGRTGFADPDDQILAPLATVQKRLGSGAHLRSLSVQVASQELLTEAQEAIETLLRRRHRIPAGRDPDFTVASQEEILRTRAEVARTFTLLLAGIALVSLVVGGIGIMNIMLVSVAERTREIGIRKAIGARRRDILRQFLIESVTVCLTGGALGAALGVGSSFLVAYLAGWPVSISVPAIGLSFGFATATGVFFGLYPAHKASRLDPIEALRYE